MISSNGTWLTYSIIQNDPQAGPESEFVVEQDTLNPAVPLQVLTSRAEGFAAEFASVSSGGRYVAYSAGTDSVTLQHTISKTTTFIGGAAGAPYLSNDGNAIAYTALPAADGSEQIVLESLGPVVGVEPVGNSNRFDAAAWHEVQQDGLLVSTPAMATIQTPLPIDFGNLHLGQAATDTLSIANTATPAGALLDASIDGLSGVATASGSITQLAAGATDSTDVSVASTPAWPVPAAALPVWRFSPKAAAPRKPCLIRTSMFPAT